MATEEQLELAPEDYRPDQWNDGSVVFDGMRYDSREHARWAFVMSRLNVNCDYQPEHFGLTIDVGLRPTFRLTKAFGSDGPNGFLHCVACEPSKATQFCCQYLAHNTGLPVWIAIGSIRPPSTVDGPMPILATTGSGYKLASVGIGEVERFIFCPHDSSYATNSRLAHTINRAQESFLGQVHKPLDFKSSPAQKMLFDTQT